ncbi:MAG: hypothetical protein Q9173_007386 [Seirophora scorigena]
MGKRSWADRLESITQLALDKDLQQLIDTERMGPHASEWVTRPNPSTSVGEVRRLFRVLLLADVAEAHGVKDKAQSLKTVQSDMGAEFDKLDSEGKKFVGVWIQDILKGTHDEFQRGVDLALRLSSLCNQHGPASILYLWGQLTDSLIAKITKKGDAFEKAKLALNTLGLGEEAENSGAKSFAKEIRARLLQKFQAAEVTSLSSGEGNP